MLGMTLAGARSALYTVDFAKYSWLYGCYRSSNIDKVVSQSPGGGAQVPRTTPVKIFLQADNCLATVPNMLGMTLAAARSALYAVDFAKYSWLYGCYRSSNIDKVVSQSPGGGAQVPRTTPVKIFLQADNCLATVPNMLGMTLAAARSALYAVDIAKYSWLYGCYRSSNIDKVVSQNPGGGAQVPRTTPVKIFLQADNC